MRAYKIWNLKTMPWGSLSLSKAKSTVQAISACNLERNPNLWQNKQFRAALRASFTGASVTDQQESKEMHSNEWRHWERPAGVHGKLQGGVVHLNVSSPAVCLNVLKVRWCKQAMSQPITVSVQEALRIHTLIRLSPCALSLWIKGDGLLIALKHFDSCCYFNR